MLQNRINTDLTSENMMPQLAESLDIPRFDLHKVEESLKINHRVFNGIPMTEDEINEAVTDYRLFLRDHKASGAPELFDVPSLVVDRVWHTHMCETKQYRDDCLAYFGKIVEHRSEICDGGVDE